MMYFFSRDLHRLGDGVACVVQAAQTRVGTPCVPILVVLLMVSGGIGHNVFFTVVSQPVAQMFGEIDWPSAYLWC